MEGEVGLLALVSVVSLVKTTVLGPFSLPQN